METAQSVQLQLCGVAKQLRGSSDQTDLEQLEPTQTDLEQLEPTQTDSNRLGAARTDLNRLGSLIIRDGNVTLIDQHKNFLFRKFGSPCVTQISKFFGRKNF